MNNINKDHWYEEPEPDEPHPLPAYVMTGRYRYILQHNNEENHMTESSRLERDKSLATIVCRKWREFDHTPGWTEFQKLTAFLHGAVLVAMAYDNALYEDLDFLHDVACEKWGV